MLGQAAVAMWWDISPEMKAEFEDWHSREHMPERLAIPGFLRGTRWIAESAEPSYFVFYEVKNLGTPHHRNMVRSLCVLRAGWGGGLPQSLATMRFSPTSKLPELPQGQGLTGVHLLESQPMAGAPQTAEQKIRGADRTADWVMLVGGYDAEAVKAVATAGGLYRPAYSLTSNEKP